MAVFVPAFSCCTRAANLDDTPIAKIPLESIAEECGVAEVIYHLQKAKMAMIAAHAS